MPIPSHTYHLKNQECHLEWEQRDVCLPAQNPPHLRRIELYCILVLGLHEWQISSVACADMPKLCSMSLINAPLKGLASWSGWKESGARGSVSNCLCGRISLGWLISMLNSTGNHAWVVHFSTINMPVASSLLIFFKQPN